MTKDEAMKPADGPGTVPERRQFHPAYAGATELELIENAADLVFERELALNELPRRIDLLVILKNDGTEIRSVLGRIFRRINVWEFKSPHDSLTVYDYHKTLSYVYQYLSEYGKGRAVSDCTISFLKEGKPRELMKELKLLGYTEKKIQPGLYWYRLENLPDMQIVNIAEKGMPAWLRLLTAKAEESDLKKTQTAYGLLPEEKKMLVDTVWNMTVKVNRNKHWMKEVDADMTFVEMVEEMHKLRVEYADVTNRLSEAERNADEERTRADEERTRADEEKQRADRLRDYIIQNGWSLPDAEL